MKLNDYSIEELQEYFDGQIPIGARHTELLALIFTIEPTTKEEFLMLEVIKLQQMHLDIALKAVGEFEDDLAEQEIYVGDYRMEDL